MCAGGKRPAIGPTGPGPPFRGVSAFCLRSRPGVWGRGPWPPGFGSRLHGRSPTSRSPAGKQPGGIQMGGICPLPGPQAGPRGPAAQPRGAAGAGPKGPPLHNRPPRDPRWDRGRSGDRGAGGGRRRPGREQGRESPGPQTPRAGGRAWRKTGEGLAGPPNRAWLPTGGPSGGAQGHGGRLVWGPVGGPTGPGPPRPVGGSATAPNNPAGSQGQRAPGCAPPSG